MAGYRRILAVGLPEERPRLALTWGPRTGCGKRGGSMLQRRLALGLAGSGRLWQELRSLVFRERSCENGYFIKSVKV